MVRTSQYLLLTPFRISYDSARVMWLNFACKNQAFRYILQSVSYTTLLNRNSISAAI